MKLAHDPLRITECIEFINGLMSNITVEQLAQIKHSELDTAWREWLTASSYNRVNGLEQFNSSCFSAGTTPAFGEFISRFPNRRVRVSRSDFVITRILCTAYQRPMTYLEIEKLDKNDCLILSFPFSGNGSYYPDHEALLNSADELNIPVFVDAAYFGISHGIDYPLHRPCVTDFAVSLSKNLAGNTFRTGVRFTRKPIDDGLSATLIAANIFDRINSYLAIKLLAQFPHDWLIDKYCSPSKTICLQNNLTPTQTITIGIGGPEHIQFKRGDYIRVCISEELSRLS